jgi:hypothetical protein
LAVYHADGDTPYGYGLIKLDKDSKLLWAFAENVHHDVDVGEDGRIYTLTQKLLPEVPPGVSGHRGPYIADYLVVLSPDGQKLQSIPLLETFRDSPYALLLAAGNKFESKGQTPLPPPPGFPQPPPMPSGPNVPPSPENGDILHTNSVRVLRKEFASKFPLFKSGQLLISLRELDTLAVLDPETSTLVWAGKGVWRGQHDAQFLDNGHLLLFDNLGTFGGSRVLEFNPQTQAIPWTYESEKSVRFSAFFRGTCQRLPNGNTLIVDPDGGRIFEVSPENTIVWQWFCPQSSAPQQPSGTAVQIRCITGARRYHSGEVSFLEGGPRVRP